MKNTKYLYITITYLTPKNLHSYLINKYIISSLKKNLLQKKNILNTFHKTNQIISNTKKHNLTSPKSTHHLNPTKLTKIIHIPI